MAHGSSSFTTTGQGEAATCPGLGVSAFWNSNCQTPNLLHEQHICQQGENGGHAPVPILYAGGDPPACCGGRGSSAKRHHIQRTVAERSGIVRYTDYYEQGLWFRVVNSYQQLPASDLVRWSAAAGAAMPYNGTPFMRSRPLPL